MADTVERDDTDTRTEQTDDRVEKARGEERAKLYATLEKKELKAKEAEAKSKELAERLDKLEQEKKDRELAELSETEALKRRLADATRQAEDAARLAKQREDELADVRRRAELDKFRDKMIRKAKLDPDFEFLVRGDDESEILASIEAAKEKIKDLEEKFAPRQETPTRERPQAPAPSNPGTPPAPLNAEMPDISHVTSLAAVQEYKRRIRVPGA
jgi:multidrug efflux pump subunit AcrA (membrane-fusion protein)